MAKTSPELLDLGPSSTHWPVRLVAGIVFLNGLFAILEVLYTRFSIRLEGLLPLNYEEYGRFFGLFSGFLLIYFSGRLLARKQLAWWIALIGSGLIVIDHALLARSLSALILPSTSLVLLVAYQDQFQVRSEPVSLRQGLRLFGLAVVISLLYGIIGFSKLLPRDFMPAHHISVAEAAVRTVREFTLIGNTDLTPRTHYARWFIDSLDIFGSVSIAFAFLSLFRPLNYRYRTLPQERSRARALLEQYGTSSEDAFKLWPEDKSYFFSNDGTAFVAYRVERGVALVLGEPIGPVTAMRPLLRQFRVYCHLHDWSVALVYVTQAHLKLFEEVGFKPLKIGEDATVELSHFMVEVGRDKHFRGVRNKFNRLGYRFVVSRPPHSSAVISGTARVTRSWLETEGRVERGFALGYYDREYLQRNDLYLVYDDKNQLVAFANAIYSYKQGCETVDLMRHISKPETGTMDFLLLGVLEHLAEQGTQDFSLGLAPMAGVGVGPERTLEERVVGYISRLGIGGFSYQGLRRFKDKFEPRWEDRYLVYERGPVGLAWTAAALGRVMQER